MENQAINGRYLNLILEVRHEYLKLFRKSDQRKNLHDPYYLMQNKYIADTPIMRVLAKDITFCRYQFQTVVSDSHLVYDGTDYEKLRLLLYHEYGISINVGKYFACHRLYRLMQYIEKNISEGYRKAVLDREQTEKELGMRLFQLICDCCKGRKPRMESNPAFIDIDFKQFEAELYRQYHIFFSSYERRQLNTVKDIILRILFRLRDGGRI